MALVCDVVVDPGVTFDEHVRLADLLQHAAESESALAGGRWQMTVRLCDDTMISELHGRFLADPTPTDVITFPSGDTPHPDGAYLGDVVVSVETAMAQSSIAGHSWVREVAFLALHGLLHLCGYDDMIDEQREAMHQRQTCLLADWERERGRTW